MLLSCFVSACCCCSPCSHATAALPTHFRSLCTVLGIWYWCTDQTIVQRVLGAATIRDAQLGPLFAAAIKFLPVPLFVFPGVMAYVLYSDEVEVPDDAIFVLIRHLVPPGCKGLILAGMLSALMCVPSMFSLRSLRMVVRDLCDSWSSSMFVTGVRSLVPSTRCQR